MSLKLVEAWSGCSSRKTLLGVSGEGQDRCLEWQVKFMDGSRLRAADVSDPLHQPQLRQKSQAREDPNSRSR